MLKIGDFSKLANVTVKTLRHYAELGLLQPAWIDRYTGYRYYALEQLPRINRILALKDLGLSLEQIKRVLNSPVSAEELRGMFHLKQAEFQQMLRAEGLRLARIEARLKQIEQEGKLAVDGVIVRSIPALPVASLRLTAADPGDVHTVRERARAEIEHALAKAGIPIEGPWLSLAASSEFVERSIPVEMAVVLAELPQKPVAQAANVRFLRLPPVPHMAVYAHIGSFADLPQAYTTVYSWLETSGFRVSGGAREVLLTETDRPNPEWSDRPVTNGACIEVQLPVEPIRILYQNQEFSMEPKFVDQPSIMVAGTLYYGKNKNQEIGVMWDQQFIPRIDEIQRADPVVSYGVCDDPDTTGNFRYISGVEVKRPEDAPADMTIVTVPAGRYAVFEHAGPLSGLGKTYNWIYTEWLPKSGYKRANRPDLEVYNEDFKDEQPDSILYLYVPIE